MGKGNQSSSEPVDSTSTSGTNKPGDTSLVPNTDSKFEEVFSSPFHPLTSQDLNNAVASSTAFASAGTQTSQQQPVASTVQQEAKGEGGSSKPSPINSTETEQVTEKPFGQQSVDSNAQNAQQRLHPDFDDLSSSFDDVVSQGAKVTTGSAPATRAGSGAGTPVASVPLESAPQPAVPTKPEDSTSSSSSSSSSVTPINSIPATPVNSTPAMPVNSTPAMPVNSTPAMPVDSSSATSVNSASSTLVASSSASTVSSNPSTPRAEQQQVAAEAVARGEEHELEAERSEAQEEDNLAVEGLVTVPKQSDEVVEETDLAIASNPNTSAEDLAAVGRRVPDENATVLQQGILRAAINNPSVDESVLLAVANEPLASEDILLAVVEKTSSKKVLAAVFAHDKYGKEEDILKALVKNNAIEAGTLLAAVAAKNNLLGKEYFTKENLIKFLQAKEERGIDEGLKESSFEEDKLLKLLNNPNVDAEVLDSVIKANAVKAKNEDGSVKLDDKGQPEPEAIHDDVQLKLLDEKFYEKLTFEQLLTIVRLVPNEGARRKDKNTIEKALQHPVAEGREEELYKIILAEPSARKDVLKEIAAKTSAVETMKSIITHRKVNDDVIKAVIKNSASNKDVWDFALENCKDKAKIQAAIDKASKPEEQEARDEAIQARAEAKLGEDEARRVKAVDEARKAAAEGGDALLRCFRGLETEEKEAAADDDDTLINMCDLGEQGRLSKEEVTILHKAAIKKVKYV